MYDPYETYKIGQIIKITDDIKATNKESGESVTIPKGSEFIIGADYMMHNLKNQQRIRLDKNEVEKAYDTKGLAQYLAAKLKHNFPLWEECQARNAIETDDDLEEEIKDEIFSALKEIGFN